MIYYAYAVVLQNLSSEDFDGFGRIFKHLPPIERFKILCLWITRERARLILCKRLTDVGVSENLLRELDERTFRSRYCFSINKKVLSTKRKKGIPNALTRVLENVDGKHIKPISHRMINEMKDEPATRTDAVSILSPFIQALEGEVMEQRTITNFRRFVRHLHLSNPQQALSERSGNTEQGKNAENRKRWLRESWPLMGLSLLEASFTLLPLLESSEEGAKRVLDDFDKKDNQGHFEQNIILAHGQDIDKKFQPADDFVTGASRAGRITYAGEEWDEHAPPPPKQDTPVYQSIESHRTEIVQTNRREVLKRPIRKCTIPSIAIFEQERIANPKIDQHFALKRSAKLGTPVTTNKTPRHPLQKHTDVVLDLAVTSVCRDPEERRRVKKAIKMLPEDGTQPNNAKIARKCGLPPKTLKHRLERIKARLRSIRNLQTPKPI